MNSNFISGFGGGGSGAPLPQIPLIAKSSLSPAKKRKKFPALIEDIIDFTETEKAWHTLGLVIRINWKHDGVKGIVLRLNKRK